MWRSEFEDEKAYKRHCECDAVNDLLEWVCNHVRGVMPYLQFHQPVFDTFACNLVLCVQVLARPGDPCV